MAEVGIQNISKSFGETLVLEDVSLDIKDREFMTLVGPSGCGKSTLLRIIAGLEAQDSGNIVIGRDVVDHTRPSHRDIAMVFQSYALYPHLTVSQNIAVPLRMQRSRLHQRLPVIGRFAPGSKDITQSIEADVHEVARSLHIEHLLARKPGQLSGGQRQRVALGRAMVRQPKAFLMDEPLSNLDAKLRVHMRAEIAQLHRRLQTTFVYVTHDQAEAMTMSDRIAVMMNGHILQVAPPDEVYRQPADIRVAEFIGSPKINIFPGCARSDNAVEVLGRTMALQAKANARAEIRIGLRPENIQLTAPKNGDFTGRIVYAENLGPEWLVHVGLEGLPNPIVVRSDPEADIAIEIDRTVGIALPAGKALVFAKNGARIPVTDATVLGRVVNG